MLATKMIIAIVLVGVLVFAFGAGTAQQPAVADAPTPSSAKTLYVAGGCFWCLESQFEMLQGVYSVESGYAGGSPAGVSYEEVSSGRTGHAETVKISYDPKQISEEDLLRVFFTIHDPTTLNRQGPDSGTQYRSAIFYQSADEKAVAKKIFDEITKARVWHNTMVTEISPLKNWTRAEEYHQNYFVKYEKATPAQRMHMNSGYCALVVEPHVIEFRHKYADKLKRKQ